MSLLCHLRATPMCESTIKAFKNNKQLPRACVRAKTTLLYYCIIFFLCVNGNCIDFLMCQHNKRTISKRFALSLITEQTPTRIYILKRTAAECRELPEATLITH